ncbi:MAG: hypothetical protein M1570_14445 [Chloroflexi bacterium]|nr:hypothetical protein [Chloroflexota bacterium]
MLKWLMESEPNEGWSRATLYFPARQSTREALADFIKENPLLGTGFEWQNYGRKEPAVAAWGAVRGILADAVTAVANGKASPESALQVAAEKAMSSMSQ